MAKKKDYDWEDVLKAAAEFQAIVPNTILVGGTASALHAGHRASHDADHIIEDLNSQFDRLLEFLEQHKDWQTNRIKPPVLILGNFQGVETGIRQLIRKKPLDTVTIKNKFGNIKVPSAPEMLRIKAWLIITRNALRDFIDFTALSNHLGLEDTVNALSNFDEYYAENYNSDTSPLVQVARQLAEPLPFDLSESELSDYRGLVQPWDKWENIKKSCIELASKLV